MLSNTTITRSTETFSHFVFATLPKSQKEKDCIPSRLPPTKTMKDVMLEQTA